jgi:Tol biopolymer transport system component
MKMKNIITMMSGCALILTMTSCSKWFAEPDAITYRQDAIFFSSNRGGNRNIYMMNLDGTDVVQITHYTEGDYFPVDISSDGKRLLFNRFDENTLVSGVFIMNLDESEPSEAIYMDLYYGSNFLSDGHRFVGGEHVFTPEGGFERFYICDSRDRSQQQINRDSTHHFGVSVSHDGSRITYISWPAGAFYQQLCVSNIDGSNEIALTDTFHYSSSGRFTPDGNKVLFSLGDIYWVSSEGGPLHQITRLSSSGYCPFADPAGENVYFNVWDGDYSEIMSIQIDGTAQKRLTFNQYADSNPVVGFVNFTK